MLLRRFFTQTLKIYNYMLHLFTNIYYYVIAEQLRNHENKCHVIPRACPEEYHHLVNFSVLRSFAFAQEDIYPSF